MEWKITDLLLDSYLEWANKMQFYVYKRKKHYFKRKKKVSAILHVITAVLSLLSHLKCKIAFL